MSKTRFSLVIACYNAELFLRECLDSVVQLDYPRERYEIVCIDDGSTDGSPAILREYQKRNDNMIVRTTENLGLEKSRNRAIGISKNDRIVPMDSDDRLPTDYLKVMDSAITKHPEHSFYYCQDYFEVVDGMTGPKKTLPDFNAEEIFERGDFFATGTVYKKSVLEEIGGYPETVKNCGLENYSVILELLDREKTGCAVKGASFYYRRHAGSLSSVRRDFIVEFGQELLARYGRTFRTNEFHPYGLTVAA